MFGPDKNKLYPNENIKTVCYIRNLPKRPNVEMVNTLITAIIINLLRDFMIT